MGALTPSHFIDADFPRTTDAALHLNERPRDDESECCESLAMQADVDVRPTKTASDATDSKPYNEALLDALL